MQSTAPKRVTSSGYRAIFAGIVFVAAVACMWPARSATFVSGDDERLILNHLLVNHPSPEHAWTLLSRVTDDLYQPLPMISFQVNYALAGPDATGRFTVSARGFHWTNMLLHGCCAVLAFFISWRIAWCARVGLLAGLLFVCHPFAVETVAWINGRMILLGTLFALLMIWLRIRPAGPSAIGAMVAWIASVLSKVMPTTVLAALWCEWRVRGRLTRRDWNVYAVLLAIALATTALAAASTLDATSGDDPEYQTNTVVRMLLAGRYYVENYFWPSRLCAWSPPPPNLAFTDPSVLIAVAEIVAFAVSMMFLRRRSPTAFLGLGLFALLLVPFLAAGTTRRILAADRYMYLPMIGLHLAVAALVVQSIDALKRKGSAIIARAMVGLPVAATLAACFWWSRQLCETWVDSVRRDERVVFVHPNEPDTHAQLAKAHLFQRDPDAALRVISEARARLGDTGRLAATAGEALRLKKDYVAAERELRIAVEKLPEHTRINFLYALTLEDLSRYDDARTRYEKLVSVSPDFLPALTALARCHRRDGHTNDAAKMYERALVVNENNVESLRSLAGILMESKQDDRAMQLLERAAQYDVSDITATAWLHILLVENGRGAQTAALWERVRASGIVTDEVWAWQAWGYIHAAREKEAQLAVNQIPVDHAEHVFANWALGVATLARGDESAIVKCDKSSGTTTRFGTASPEKRRLFISTIERMSENTRGSPAAMYLVARAFLLDGQREAARRIASQLVQQPSGGYWKDAAGRLLADTATTGPSAPH
ncbi:MAG: hypothetical protein AABZ08_08455 [Planctomycetota bacterium]